jgi:radical SAM superfamily enzyme YgiQ (UPF0313 family)
VDFNSLVDLAISKPARYLGNELGVISRDWNEAWSTARVRWALTYPEVYEVGSSNLGHIILYSILNSVPGQLCDRSYLPAADLSARLRQRDLSLFAVESRRPLGAFDLLGFSLSYELGATNILEMLDLAGIPLQAAERGDLPLADPAAPPLIFAGGPTATSNPEPFAAFFDFIALGDGEELLPEIGLVVAEARAAGRELEVDYILATDPGTRHYGTVKEIHEQAEVRGEEGNTVLVRVTIDPSRHEKEELGAGASVTARISCGKRSLGYVWFHDVLAFIQTQVLFRLW